MGAGDTPNDAAIGNPSCGCIFYRIGRSITRGFGNYLGPRVFGGGHICAIA